MAIYENLKQFAGTTVEDFDPEIGIQNPKRRAYRLRLDYDEAEEGQTWEEKLASLLADPNASQVEALVVGAWGEVASGESSAPVVEALASARDRLPNLKHLFFGDITMEESEISWISQSDVSPLLEAYPNLEHFTVRGGMGLSLGTPRHAKLRELVIQAGGLSAEVVHEIAAAELPALQHLELWLGDPGYGADVTVDDLAPLLKGDRFPHLKYLGLKNSIIEDDVAAVVALAPVLDRLEVLDLSMGTLGDIGAKALLGSSSIKKLKKLDVHHHFISSELVKQLESLGIEVDASDEQEPHNWGGEDHRFTEVNE
jgi:hypothetical protein